MSPTKSLSNAVTAGKVAGRSAPDDPVDLARQLLADALAGRADGSARAILAAYDLDELESALADDDVRKAFWLNVYNAIVRARLQANPAMYRRRWRFFYTSAVTVAGRRLSPNAIEHGILRRSAFTLSLGYLHNPWPSGFERRMRIKRVDPRIHFALNCGARSCPRLASWNPATLEEDIEAATRAYLSSECSRSLDNRELTIPRLLLWYSGDFGGRAGVLALLRRHGVVKTGESPRLRYGEYDWSLDLADSADGK